MVIFSPSHACIFGVDNAWKRRRDCACTLCNEHRTTAVHMRVSHQDYSSNNHGSFFVHMLFCKHVRLSCVISAYSLTYLLTYLNFPMPFLRGEVVTHFVRVEWIELYSVGKQKPVIALSEFVLHFRYVSPF